MKRIANWMLMAAVVCGLSFAVTSCKDDDDEKNKEEEQVGGETTVNMLLSDEEAVLASLIQQWCGVEPETIVSGIGGQTFEPTVGDVADASQPHVRTLILYTQEAADAYAVSALSILNINPQQPDGFSWSGEMGSISYQHGSGNELGIINVSLKQIPHLTKLRLVAEADGNAPNPGLPYYRKGDIVKYTGKGALNGKYFICLSNHNAGQPSNWISFDSENDRGNLSKGDCSWAFTGKDYVFNGEMASTSDISIWLQEFILNDDQYDEVKQHMSDAKLNNYDINQIIPVSDQWRQKLIRGIIRKSDDVVLDAWEPLTKGGTDIQAIKANWPTEVEAEKSGYDTKTYFPLGLLLCNTMRWSNGFTYHYWVPNLSLMKELTESIKLSERVKNAASQNTLSPKHFTWLAVSSITVNSRVLTAEENGVYDLHQTAVHWTHDYFKVSTDNKKHYGLLDFTAKKTGVNDNDWTRRNITSHKLTVTDEGKAYKYFEDVYNRNKEAGKVKKIEYGFFFTGSIIEDETGTRWFCYAGWQDNKDIKTIDKKARFFTFQNIQTQQEPISGGSGQGTFAVGDLMPEKEAPLFCYFLSFLDTQNIGSVAAPTREYLVSHFDEMGGPKCNQIMTRRDTTYIYPDDNTVSHACIFSSNVVYLPENGRTVGTQPYMRYINDQTLMGDNRDTHKTTAYFYQHFNSNYHDRAAQLDLTHLFTASNYLTNNAAIPWDKYSHCKHEGTENRDGGFSAADRYTTGYNTLLFNQDPSRYKSAYHDPVIVARYLELDDPGESFRTTYNGHTYKLISQPNDLIKVLINGGEFIGGLIFTHNESTGIVWTNKNGVGWNIPYLIYYVKG